MEEEVLLITDLVKKFRNGDFPEEQYKDKWFTCYATELHQQAKSKAFMPYKELAAWAKISEDLQNAEYKALWGKEPRQGKEL